MSSLLFQFGAGPVSLFLVLCLQLGAINSQESTSWSVMNMSLQLQKRAKVNEEVPLTLRLSTDVKECMVVKTYLRSDKQLEGSSHTYTYTSCLCDDYPRTLFWDIRSNTTVTIWAVADIIRQTGICPEDRAVIPIKANRFYISETLWITS
ncbi:PREDICTED: prolactin-inducible protein homolog [Elephantulus edwardii]|uniref:prolactin-inducible protein homolog n=1 Tax=Elephantulus edwardii TaxID=28737 RepID=UPI0003F0C9D7|nr:PREDICTED: prolactin-inducible protein homolog [Elephantulus edwardii]